MNEIQEETLEEILDQFLETILPSNAGTGQIKDMRLSFVAGAKANFEMMIRSAGKDESEAVEDMQKMQEDMERLIKRYLR